MKCAVEMSSVTTECMLLKRWDFVLFTFLAVGPTVVPGTE